MTLTQAIPLLRVTDVARSIEWYNRILGFLGVPFPPKPPYEFAILRASKVEIMLRRSPFVQNPKRRQYDWDVYIRLEGGRFRESAKELLVVGVVTRQPERMFYGAAEFEITDPDCNVLCVSEALEDASDLPTPGA